MAPRNISATSVSTTSELSHSMFTESHATESQNVHSAGPASIDVMSLDDPAAMSPQAIKAELQYYGVQLKFNSLSKQELEDELIKLDIIIVARSHHRIIININSSMNRANVVRRHNIT